MDNEAHKTPDNTIDSDVLLEQIVDQFTAQLRSGQQPSISDYQQLYPHLAAELADVLSSVSIIEQLKSTQDASSNSQRLLDQVTHLERIGPYKIVREIGRGGMGVVFEANHETLGRKVAIKVLPNPIVDSQNYVERFRQEAQAAAKLHHTNIVSVFGVGEGPSYHYYVMDFVDGANLKQWIENQKNITSAKPDTHHTAQRFRWVASLGWQLADALSYAHSVGILHRDLKPANMILDRHDRIWLTDFGLAKDNSSQLNLTKTGDVIGTPQYLPPESLDSRYDVRSEVYGIGLAMYELVSLQPAFTGASPAELLRAVASRTPQALAKVVPQIPRDLATIIEKSIAREPSARYSSAADLGRDLQAFLEDRPIAARRPSHLESLVLWSKRNPLAAGLTATTAVLLLLVAITSLTGYLITTSALRSLRVEQTKTAAALIQSEQNFRAMKAQYDRAESNMSLSLDGFEELFRHMISRGSKVNVDAEIEGLREISGIGPSLTREDAVFLDRMVKFYEQFAQVNADNELLKTEAARAYRRVGNIYQLVGQPQSAIEAYEKSLGLQTPADRSGLPAMEQTLLLSYVRTQNELSSAHRMNGSPIQAQEFRNRSIRLLDSAIRVRPDFALRLELARTKSSFGFDVLSSFSGSFRPGSVRPATGERTEGDRPQPAEWGKRLWNRVNKPLIFEAIEILDQLLVEDPNCGECLAQRAACYWCLAAAELEQDQAQGFSYRNRSIAELDKLLAQYPDNTEYKYLLALACGLTLPSEDRSEQNLVERGALYAQQLIDDHPSVLTYHHLHAKLKIRLAGYATQQQDRDRAYESLQSAKKSIMVLSSKSSSDRTFGLTMDALLRELTQLGQFYVEAGNARTANEISQMVRQIRQARNKQQP